MAATLAPVIKQHFSDANGRPLVGGKVYTYQAGTSTPKATYTDTSGTVANTNPVILDANGEASICLGQGYYKFVLADANGVVLKTVDNVPGLMASPGMLVVPFSANPEFNAALASIFDITLSGDVTSSTLTNVVAGQLVTFIVAQDATGNRAFAWPSNVHSVVEPDKTANAISVQTFIAREDGNLYPIGPMTVN